MRHTFSDIAITGFSAISAAGVGIAPVLELIHSGSNALQPIPHDVPGLSSLHWAKVESFKASEFMPVMKARKMDRCSQFAVAAAGLALKDAAVDLSHTAPHRVGIALGSGFCGLSVSAEFLTGYFKDGCDGLVPIIFPNTVPNAPASYASIEQKFNGPNITFVQRFCSAEVAILNACRFIEEGRADVMLAGGTDEINSLLLKGFAELGYLKSAEAPYGEGCGIIVLERGSHARERGAVIHGMVKEVRSIGRLIPGYEKEGIGLLTDTQDGCSLFSLSGCAADMPEIVESAGDARVLDIGAAIGRSLAMGGAAMAVLTASLAEGKRGVHVATSPEGPYFAIDVSGGCSV